MKIPTPINVTRLHLGKVAYQHLEVAAPRLGGVGIPIRGTKTNNLL